MALLGEQLASQRVFATIDLADLMDLQQTRPVVQLADGVTRTIAWPSIEFVAGNAGRDVVLCRGPEPSLRWRAVLGAIGDPSVPSGVLERGFLLKLRFAFDHHVNLRPSKLLPGVATPLAGEPQIDFVVVREGTEGPYTGNGGTIRKGTEHEVATEVSVNTAFGVERVVRDAFARAQARPRKKLALIHKNNVLTFAGHLWTNIFNKVAKEFPEVTTDYIHVDAATIYLVTDPARFDVIVTDNLFGDIITDLAAAVSGGIGVAASGNINPSGEFPSMFEPVHGSAPDIAGQGKADPTATVLSVALLLRHLGYESEAGRIEAAVAADLTERGDSVRTTDEIGDALAVRVAS